MRNGGRVWMGRRRSGNSGTATTLTAGLLLAAGTLLTACAETPSASTPLESLPRELTAAELEVISASNAFAFELFRRTDQLDGDGNIFLSPLSASMALGMTMNGARGVTLDEMRAALGFGQLELQRINESYRGLIDLLLQLDGSVDTRIANSIWYRDGFPFEQPFFDLAREYFSAEVEEIPMAPSDRDVINAWVDRATAGKIPSIVDQVRPDHVMFLINAIYFKGSWTEQFDRSRTRDEPFYLQGGGTRQVKMMNGHAAYGLGGTAEYQAVDLPYGNGAFSMTILVPRDGVTVDDVVESLDPEAWQALTSSLQEREFDLAMPRFRMEYRRELNETLKALGMVSAFEPGQADFTGMSSSMGRSLLISKVLQKTFVEVNEEGTEAAAATSVEVVLTSLPPSVRIDRPFVFAIRERFSGTILFIGKMVDPG